jgi:hypothetical protein
MSLTKYAQISQDTLKDIYNESSSEILQKFLPIAKRYSLDNLDNQNDDNIRLMEKEDGNYWAVDIVNQDSQNRTDKDYMLLPNKNQINKIFQNSQKDNYQSLFSFLGNLETKTKTFKLIKPAIVSYTSVNEGKWEVKETGEVEFINNDNQDTEKSLPQKSEKIDDVDSDKSIESRDDLLKKIEKLEKKINEIQNIQPENNYVTFEQVESLIQKYLSKHSLSIVTLNEKILSIEDNQNLKINVGNNHFPQVFDAGNKPEDLLPASNTLEPPIINLVNIYNNNSKSLSSNILEVSETCQSIDNRRLGYNQPVALEKVSRNKGIAWVINIDGSDYLVPKPKLKINEYNYETIESLFICHGYESGVSYEFILIKPAKLLAQEKGERWELSEKGELRFQTQSS